MNSIFSPRILISLAFVCGQFTTFAAPVKITTVVRPLSTNALPKSVFVVPTTEADGRDPFFPKSDRLKKTGTAKATTPKAPTLILIYNGLSGTENHRLAIINGRTLAEGEETELPMGNSRVKIRCVEIKGETVIVEALGERRELRLGATR